jgi:hypothetical protein
MVFSAVATAARELLRIENPAPSVTAIVAALADTARELAQKIQEGDANIASGDFVGAIQSFKHAWQRASQR